MPGLTARLPRRTPTRRRRIRAEARGVGIVVNAIGALFHGGDALQVGVGVRVDVRVFFEDFVEFGDRVWVDGGFDDGAYARGDGEDRKFAFEGVARAD